MDISKITLPSGNTYNIKDEVARQAMTGGMHFRGVSTTAVTDGGDENPTIDGQKYYSKRTGDVVVYDSKEFVYSCNDTPLSSPYLHLTTYDYTVQSYHIVSTYDRSTQVLTCTDNSAGLIISFDVTYTANSVTFTYKSNTGWSSVNSKKFNWTQSGTSGSIDLRLSTSFTKTFSNTDTAPVTGISLSGTDAQTHRLATGVYTDYYEGHWTEFGDLSDLGDLAYIDKDGDATKYLNGTGSWTVPPKNTAGSTDTSSKIFLIGATSQAASPQTYSHDTAYVGTDGCLYSGGNKVLTAHQTIKQDGVTGATVNRYASCSTAADTAAKTASITTGTFSLEAGSIVNVKFTNTNTASTPTLNINSTGAKNIFSNGFQITTGTNKGLLKGLCTFIYDGTQYHLVGGYIDYSLPTATYNVLGGVKPWYSHTAASTGPTAGTNSTAVAVNTITTTAGKYYAVESDSNGRLFVNVPWSDSQVSPSSTVTAISTTAAAGSSTVYSRGDHVHNITLAVGDNGPGTVKIAGQNVGVSGCWAEKYTNLFEENSISAPPTKGDLNSRIDSLASDMRAISTPSEGYTLFPLTFGSEISADPFVDHHEYWGYVITHGANYTACVLFDFTNGDIVENSKTSSSWGTWRKTGSLAWKSSVSASYTPAGSVTVSTNATTNKTATVSTTSGTVTYTPGGTVGTPTISVKTAGSTTTIKNPTAIAVAKKVATAAPGATAPANVVTTCDVSNETLRLYQVGYTTGDSITTSNVTVKTGDAEYQSSQPSWTGTGVRLVTGNIAVPSTYTANFSGTAATITSN